MRAAFRRFLGLFRRKRSDTALDEEIRVHLDLLADDFLRRGMTVAEARAAAQREFGRVVLIKEQYRDQRGWPFVDACCQDLRYALRSLTRNRGFAAVAILTLALGIGANTAVFSVMDALLLHRPDFEHLDRLVSFREDNPQELPFDVDPSPGNFLDWRDQSRSFEHIAAWRNWYFTLGEPQQGARLSESVRGVSVSPTFFAMLGVRPAIGRTFQPAEEEPGNNHAVLLSDGLWKRRFGADRTILGRAVLIDGMQFSVIGVLPADFQFFQPDLDIWMPLTVDASFHDRRSHSVMVFGRLAPDVSLVRAQAEMDVIADRLSRYYPDTNGGWRVRISALYPTQAVLDLRPALLVLFGAASLVLLIACANVANLLLARASARRQEMMIRVAIGAGQARLIRQLLTETFVLVTLSAAVGTFVATQGIRLLVPLLPRAGTNTAVSAFRAVAPAVDVRMLGFSLTIAILTSAIVGVLPAFRTTRISSLRTSSTSQSRVGRLLIVTELALSIVLLTGAALLVESFWRLQRVNPGFPSDHLLTMQLWMPKARHGTPDDIRGYQQEVIRRVSALPAVAGAAEVSYRPFLGMGMGTAFEIEGSSTIRGRERPVSSYRVVSPGFIRVLGQPIVAGRDFTPFDGPESMGVAIVNESFARRYWPASSAVGQRIRPEFRRSTVPWELDGVARWLTIVGVVRDIRGFNVNEADQSQIYVSSLQFPFSYMFLIVRTSTAPLGLAAPVVGQIHAVDADQPVSDIRTMDDAIAVSVPRFNVELLALFAAVAVLLAAIGVYGVGAYSVNQRTQEIGIRMALGAESRDVLTMMLREGLWLGVAGVVAGLMASLLFARAISSLLYGVTPTAPHAYAAAAGSLLFVVLLACYVPARRASRIEPIVALRHES